MRSARFLISLGSSPGQNPLKSLPGVGFFGRKGAALAALGEIPSGLGLGLFTDRDEGVKLGESTLNLFLVLCYL